MQGIVPPADERVVVGVHTSDDAGVYHLPDSDRVLIHTADFITPVCDDPYAFGRVAAANSLSDIYAMGGSPITALNLCCFPHRGVDKESLTGILRGGLDVLTAAHCALVGGHTIKDPELKYGLAVTGIAERDQITPNSGARPGDVLILTKPVGTGVVINAHRAGEVPDVVLMRLVEQMAVLNDVAARVMVEFGCKGATDVTGFGLAGHAWEMAEASGVKLVIDAAAVPVYADAVPVIEAKVAKLQGKRPGNPKQGTIRFDESVGPAERIACTDPQTSGGLLIAIAADRADALITELRGRGVEFAAVIGNAETAGQPAVVVS